MLGVVIMGHGFMGATNRNRNQQINSQFVFGRDGDRDRDRDLGIYGFGVSGGVQVFGEECVCKGGSERITESVTDRERDRCTYMIYISVYRL